MRSQLLLAAGAALIAGPLSAQGKGAGSPATRVAAAIALPAAARELRAAGVPPREVARALEVLASRSVPADEARTVILAASGAATSGGPIENFGTFVRAQLDAGVRGRDLAAAIRKAPTARERDARPARDTATVKRGGRAGGRKAGIP